MSTSGNPKKRPYSDVSPDKSAQILSKPLDVCGKCNKKCTSAKGESIQCDLCGMWAHTTCECISREQFKAVKSLSSLSNFVYYCQVNDCASHIKNITIDWVQSHVSLQIESIVSDLTKEHLSKEYSLQKAVSDLSAKIDNLQAQELELSSKITDTSNVIGKHPSKSAVTSNDRKSNIVVFGVEECPQNTLRSARIVRDTKEVSKIFGSIDVHVEPNQILDCFRLGKFKSQQTRPRPILVKLHHAIDAATILANRSSLAPPIFIKPDLSPTERAIESILLKERWSLIQNGHSRKSIKLNSQRSCIYLNNQLYGKVINSQFQRSTQTIPTPQNTTSHPQQMDQSPLINLSSPNLVTSDPSQSTTTTQVSSDK